MDTPSDSAISAISTSTSGTSGTSGTISTSEARPKLRCALRSALPPHSVHTLHVLHISARAQTPSAQPRRCFVMCETQRARGGLALKLLKESMSYLRKNMEHLRQQNRHLQRQVQFI